MSTQRRQKRYNFCEFFVPSFLYALYMMVKLFILSYTNKRLHHKTKTRYESFKWLDSAYKLKRYYDIRTTEACEEYMEADIEYKQADGLASPLLVSVIRELKAAFYSNPVNQGKQFMWTQKMLEQKSMDVASNYKLEGARKAKRLLKRKQETYNSLSNQSLILEERIEAVLDLLDQNEDIDLLHELSELLEQQKIKVLADELEKMIFKYTDQLNEMKQETKELNASANLHGTVNQTLKTTKVHNDEYIADFCERNGIPYYQPSPPSQLPQQQVTGHEEETQPLLLLAQAT